MAKKKIALFLFCSLFLAGCQSNQQSSIASSISEESSTDQKALQSLSSPVITIDEYGLASWSEVENASRYSYSFNKETLTTEKPCQVQLTPHSSLTVTAIGDGLTYQNSQPATKSIDTLKLKTPVAQLDESGTLTWSLIEHAQSYQVTVWNKESSQSSPISTNIYENNISVSLGIGENAIVKALGDKTDYSDSNDSNIVSCHNSGWDKYGMAATDIIETVLGEVSYLPYIQPNANWTDFSLSDDKSIGVFYSTFGTTLYEVNDYIDNTLIPSWSINATTIEGYVLSKVSYSYDHSVHATPEGNVRYYVFQNSTYGSYFVLTSYFLNNQGHLKYYFSKDESVSYIPSILPVGKAPVVNVDTDGVARWNTIYDKIGNCYGYEVKINDDEPILQKENTYTLKPNDKITVKLHGDNVLSSTSSPWSLSKTYSSSEYTNLSKEDLDEKYSTSYFYEQLKKRSNATQCLALYDNLNEHCYSIFAGTTDSLTGQDSMIKVADDRYAVTSFCNADNYLSEDDVDIVYHAFKADHELYYFLDPSIYVETNESSKTYYFLCGEEFTEVETRNQYRKYLLDTIDSYQTDLLASLNYEGEKTKAIHNQILDDVDFSYNEYGGADTRVSAHSIIGGLVTGEGVCEAYARTFDLLMNHFGLETIYVYGMAYNGAGHAWDITKLDSSYYWFDPTWDDNCHDSWYLEDDVKYMFYCIYDGELIKDSGLYYTDQHYAYNYFDYPSIATTAYTGN